MAHLLFLGDLMKKIKKYVYPIVFSAAFLVSYIFLIFLIDNVISFPYGSYAPAALAVLYTFAWLIVALPIYCIRYSKIIIDEKLKFLLSVYNSLMIIISHILPFNVWGERRILTHFVLWVLFWNILLLVFRLISRKYEEKHTKSETQE